MNPANETTNSPANEVPQSADADHLDAADFAAILSSTLALAAEVGLDIGVRATQATPTRPAGLLLFIAGLSVDAQGHIVAAEFAVAAPEEPAS